MCGARVSACWAAAFCHCDLWLAGKTQRCVTTHPAYEKLLVADLEAAQQRAAAGVRLAQQQPLAGRGEPVDVCDWRREALGLC